MGDAPLSEDAGYTAGRFVVTGATTSPGVKTLGRNATGSKASAEGGPRKQLAKRKGIRNNPHPTPETLLNRYNFDEGLRRGLLQAANNNTPLPAWMLHRKSYERAGEFYVRLRAELVTPKRRDQAKIKRMLDERHSSQQQGANQYDGAVDTMPGEDVDHVDWANAKNID